MSAKLVGLGAKDEGRVLGWGPSPWRLCSVWTRQTPVGAFENVFMPKKAFTNYKKGDACHARVLGVS